MAAKDYLDAEIAKGWQDSVTNNRVFGTQHAFEQTMRKGVGAPTIAAFLGGRIYNRTKKAAHRPEKRGQNDPVTPERTSEKLADDYVGKG